MLGGRLLARHRPLIALPRAEAQEFDRPACPGVSSRPVPASVLRLGFRESRFFRADDL